MNNTDKLNVLRMIYEPNVVCTNGLFHIITDYHYEIYINNCNNELDKRTKYVTIEVTDKSIIAIDAYSEINRTLGKRLIKKIDDCSDASIIKTGLTSLIDKETLEYKYSTANELKHIVNEQFIVCDTKNSEIIDNTGKTKIKLDNCNSIADLGNGIYICQSRAMFKDKLILINDKSNVVDITKDRKYRIKTMENDKIRIELMHGGAYIFDLKTKQCFNVFTQKFENSISLFDIAL